MYFETLELKNFGPFSKYKASFSPNGVNIISGSNGVGKTQLIGAIIFSLIGKTVVDIVPKGIFPSEVTLSIREGQITELISSIYNGRNSKIQITRHTSQLNSRLSCNNSNFNNSWLPFSALPGRTKPPGWF
jgi:DNA repair exonuclease SbcCD ATPase subunit